MPFFFPPPKKGDDGFLKDVTLPCYHVSFCYFLLFSGFWFCILAHFVSRSGFTVYMYTDKISLGRPGNFARREQPEVQEMRTDVSNARQEEGFWKVNSYEKITEVEIFDVLEQGKISPNFHWVVSKIANHLHLRQVIIRRQT